MKPVISHVLAICMAFFAMNAAAYNLPDTGQTECYDDTKKIPCPKPGEPFYGQDANYTINPPSYTKIDAQGKDLPDSATDWAMVKDNVTGLIWENKQNMDGKKDYSNPHDGDNRYFWYDSNPATNGGHAGEKGDGVNNTEAFINALNAAKFGGYSDWRMPTVKELLTLTNLDRYDPAIDTSYFPNTASHYVSSYTDDTGYYVWSVWLDHTPVSLTAKWGFWGFTSGFFVRAVRGGQSESVGHFVVNGNGTVTDTDTGLIWEQYKKNYIIWKDALSYCENLTLAGYSDWRLPNINELISIVDYSKQKIDSTVFLTPEMSSYWTLSTSPFEINSAFFTSSDGSTSGTYKSHSNDVICVRGGQPVSLTPPTLVSPENLAEISASEYTFTWSHPYNDEYELIIQNDSNQTVFQSGRTKEKSFKAPLSGLSGGKTYKWYVLVYALGTSDKSSDRTFTYKGQSQITASTLVSPDNNAEITANEITFAWTHPYNDSYELFIKDETGATPYHSDKITDKSKKVVLSDIPLVNGKTYSWYVVVYANGFEKASEQRTFAYKASQQNITPAIPLVANARADIMVSERNTVTLNGSSSTGAVSYQWTMLGKAPDWIETPKLSGANSPNPTFTAPEVGIDGGSMVFQLIVTDSTGKKSSDVCNIRINNIDSDLADDAEEGGLCFISSAGNAPDRKGFWLLMAVFAVFARKIQRNRRSERGMI